MSVFRENAKQKLAKNFDSIQDRIEEINKNQSIDIKQISDLQKYTEMQGVVIKTYNNCEKM